jgi:hypothetical protein
MLTESICEILGWSYDEDAKCEKIHREMQTVMQIALDNVKTGILPGKYIGQWNGKF